MRDRSVERAPGPVEVTTGDLSPGGRCFSRLDDGTPLFVAGALPEETVRVVVSRRRAGVAEGDTVEVLSPSVDRVEPACLWFARCGGCDWMHAAYPAQLAGKQGIAAQAIRRQTGMDPASIHDGPLPIEPSPDPLAYRGRVRLHVDPGGRVGYFARGTHRVVQVDSCLLATPAVNQALDAVRQELAPLGRRFGRQVSGIELRQGDDTAPWAIHLFPRARRARLDGALLAALERVAGEGGGAVWSAGKPLLGPPRLRFDLDDDLYSLAGPAAFVQANPRANRLLVRHVVERVVRQQPRDFCDLFCGAGNFTLPLLAAGLEGTGVELSSQAVDGAREAALLQGLSAEAFRQGRVDGRARHGSPDLVLLDPPRTGARDAMPMIADMSPRTVVYVGCDPVTQARDVGELLRRGYEVVSWVLFDLFPQTHHVEGVAVLRKA